MYKFSGATTDDMYDYLSPLLKRKPTNIFLHIGSNDAPYKNVNQIAQEIENLKRFIIKKLPNVVIFLSCPTIRYDNSRANSTLQQLDQKFKTMSNFIANDNVDESCLGKKGLHLNPKGSGRLAINYISQMRRL